MVVLYGICPAPIFVHIWNYEGNVQCQFYYSHNYIAECVILTPTGSQFTPLYS